MKRLKASLIAGFVLAASSVQAGYSCSNCGWWPWNDTCDWELVGHSYGSRYVSPAIVDQRTKCAGENPDVAHYGCAVAMGEPSNAFLDLSSIAISIPNVFGVAVGWQNDTVTQTVDCSQDQQLNPGQCGEKRYCYREYDYDEAQYKRRLGNCLEVDYTYGACLEWEYNTCDDPCSGGKEVFCSHLGCVVKSSLVAEFDPPLADPCDEE